MSINNTMLNVCAALKELEEQLGGRSVSLELVQMYGDEGLRIKIRDADRDRETSYMFSVYALESMNIDVDEILMHELNRWMETK